MVKLNYPLAEELGLEAKWLEGEVGAGFFSGNHAPDGAEPLAMAYAGHQFGHFVPQLGTGGRSGSVSFRAGWLSPR
jgi:uncharacterized protein YdiU (UPF0061 family)